MESGQAIMRAFLQDPDVIVIGSGPNGLFAACLLAGLGARVLVLEANSRRPGGALASEELTLPGFVHDVGAGFFPFGRSSLAFRELDLERHGVEWLNARFESCHPALDGSYACIARDLDEAARHFGSPADGDAFRDLARFHASIEPRLLAALMLPFPAIGALLKLGIGNALRIGALFSRSLRSNATRLFESEAARRVLPGVALHVDAGPDDHFSTGLGYMLAMTATTGGYAVPRGGAQRITDALITLLENRGGKVMLGARVERIIVRRGRAHGVRLADGSEIAARRAVLSDTSAPALFLDLLERRDVPRWLQRRMTRFTHGFGTIKLDFALSAPPPWTVAEARESAVVHAGESIDDLARFVAEIRAGVLPERPYLVIGQHTLVDPSRAPEGKHTLYCYSRVPNTLPGGWEEGGKRFAERVEERIEGLAPGFRQTILARHVASPADLEKQNANLRGGDLGGGTNAWHNQLLFRPAFPYFRYRTPVRGLYLCSSYAHPGAGVHGMCGYNAAKMAARDLL
ncbi:MAG TPA: NAD(P)/FAD-dependent oxidoreductase [Polyangiaceae bacterium]|nr:NAD(P)/FAD-dependent oxidoreductase [Polyangiaceae bacterium]